MSFPFMNALFLYQKWICKICIYTKIVSDWINATVEGGEWLDVINGIIKVYGIFQQEDNATIDIKSASSIEIK